MSDQLLESRPEVAAHRPAKSDPIQTAKAIARAATADLRQARPDTVADLLARHTAPGWHWRGMHPFHEQTGAEAVAAAFWQPFLSAFSRVQRREDIFFAGENSLAPGTWTVSMGHLMGLFDAPFLGIPPHRRIAMLRYAEFHRIEGNRIVETAFFCDLVHLMMQVGLRPLPPQSGAHLVQPGPMTHDGILDARHDPAEGAKTLALSDAMCTAINTHTRFGGPEEELNAHWHDDMLWWGPAGSGATYTIERYITQHQQPFRTRIRDRQFNGHICRIGEGNYGGFFGWPNLSLRIERGYMGMTAGGMADMRVVDLYRRDGDKLAENWVFIDMLHFLNMQGLDVLERMRTEGLGAP